MKAYRLAFVLGALPLALYAYACSSDDNNSDGTKDNDAGQTQDSDASSTDEDSGSTPGDKDSGEPGTDGSVDPTDDGGADDASIDDAGDSGDAAPTDLSCVGNPLVADSKTPDGGWPDGGVVADGGALRELSVTTPGGPNPPYFVGPRWTDAVDGGALIVSQLNPETGVLLVGPDGGAATSLRKAPANSYALGNAFDKTNVITAVSSDELAGTTAIYRTTLDGGAGATTALAKTYNPTGIVIGPANNLYFTDPQYQHTPAGTTGLYRVAANGTVTAIESFNQNDVHRYNYLAITADQKTLYVTETEGARAIHKYAVGADGTVTAPPTAFAPAAGFPVGVAVDSGGNVWVAELTYLQVSDNGGNGRGGRVEVFAPTGAKLGEIRIQNNRPSSVAFGGADGKTVYVTTEENIFVYPTRCAGVR